MKLWVVCFALTVTALACGGTGGDAPTPTGTVLGVTVSPVDSLPGDAACSPADYLVEAGDTLSQIALEFDVSVDAIVEASDLDDPDVLVVGQQLTVPCPVAEAVPTESTPTPVT